MKRRETGILGESLARNYLEKRGYCVLENNYRCHEGEIDIVARHQDYLVFVEVRTKKSLKFGSPEESITQAKMKRLKACALYYQQTHYNLPESWRIDVVVIELNNKGKLSRIDLIENAIGED